MRCINDMKGTPVIAPVVPGATSTNPSEEGGDARGRQLQRTAIAAFYLVCDAWALTASQQNALLGITDAESVSMAELYKHGLSERAIERVSYVVGIYQALLVLFPAGQGKPWLESSLDAFAAMQCDTALRCMLLPSTEGLRLVRQYLDGMLCKL